MLGTGLRQLIIFVPLLYVFAKTFGVEHCWYAIWISEAVAVIYSITASVRIMKNKKIMFDFVLKKRGNAVKSLYEKRGNA
jgi:Na+-driven multidrug efflux pump